MNESVDTINNRNILTVCTETILDAFYGSTEVNSQQIDWRTTLLDEGLTIVCNLHSDYTSAITLIIFEDGTKQTGRQRAFDFIDTGRALEP